MNQMMPIMFATALALSGTPGFAARVLGPDVGPATRLTMKDCLDTQAAKHNGASRNDIQRACDWTMDENGSNNLSGTERPHTVETTPYGLMPSAVVPVP